MTEEQVLRMALACIRWNQFGECRTDGWPGLPPTAADTAAALEASLAKPQPVGGAPTDAKPICYPDADLSCGLSYDGMLICGSPESIRRVRDWMHAATDTVPVLRAELIEAREKAATLSAPVAQPGEAVSEPEPRCDMCHFKHGHRTGCPNNPAADLCTPKMLHPSHISGEWVDANGQYYALATPIAAQPVAVEPVLCQIRMRADWSKNWSDWQDCSQAAALDYEKATPLHDWHYEVRRLCLSTPAQAAVAPTYSSTQATNCAGCGKYKHTPLRIDAMDGYVCLTCIDQKLGSLLGEFGYPDAAQAAAVPEAVTDAMVDAYLEAQRATVEEADKLGRPNIGGLHTNTVREACRAGIAAALAAPEAGAGGGKP